MISYLLSVTSMTKFCHMTQIILKTWSCDQSLMTLTFLFRPKICGNCAFPQHFHTRKLGETMVFFAVWEADLPKVSSLLVIRPMIISSIFIVNLFWFQLLYYCFSCSFPSNKLFLIILLLKIIGIMQYDTLR